MEKLRARLSALISELEDADDVFEQLSELTSVYPFNEYESMISTLLGRGRLNLDDYHKLRDEYVARNPYVDVFEFSASRFGYKWAHGHLNELVPELAKPSKKLDPNYSRDYDFYLDNMIRVEVKASRAVASETDEPLYVKALFSDSRKQFDMNFQQVKCRCCDVFVWVAVWRDLIRYWVLNSRELESNARFSPHQHLGNVGEGQLHLNRDSIGDFAPYEVCPRELLDAIRAAYKRLRST